MKNIKISGKLIIAFSAIISVLAVMCGAVYSRPQTIDAAFESNYIGRSIIIETNLALTALVEQQSAVRGYVATRDKSFLSRQGEFQNNFQEASHKLDSLVSAPSDKALVAKLLADAAQVKAEQDQLIVRSRDPATADDARMHLATVGRLAKARNDVKAILKPQQEAMTAHAIALNSAVASANLTLLIGGLATVLLAIGLGWLLNRSIAHPVASMTAAMGRLSSGETSVIIPAIGQRDEVGRMADAVQIFKTNAIEKAALEQTSEADRQAVEAERRNAEALRGRQAQELARVVEALGGGLSRLSTGDLTYRIDDAFAEGYAKLKSDFNLAVNTLQNTLATILGRADGLRSSGAEITQASNDLSKRTEQQAASLEQTAAALDEITATVRRTAEGAIEARDIVAKAKADAETSGQVVKDAIVAMTRIEESSRQISQIISVIDEIAFQTNLLALNAGVEAARAGDSGKGFAVVASEVRALAQRSAEAAKEIKGLISASADQVNHGVERVGATGDALARIAQQVAQINGLVADITVSAQEQATGLNQVNAAVNQMDQVTQQNAAMVEQATAAANALHDETDALSSLLAQFKVGGADVAPSAARRAAHGASLSSAPKRSPGPAGRRSGSALAAVRAQAPEDEAHWDEF